MDLTTDISLMLTEAMGLNSGSFTYNSGSTLVSQSVVVGYGYFNKLNLTEVGYNQVLNNISVIAPMQNSLKVLKTNVTCSLVANNISGTFQVNEINNYNPQYAWITLHNRPDTVYNP